MRKVKFKTVETLMGQPPQPVTVDYRAQIESILVIPMEPEGGTQFTEMAKVYPILEKIRKAESKDHVLLEDAEHKEVVDRLKNCHFRENTPEIFLMIKEIEGSEEVKLKEVSSG